jgi:ribosomal-protein-alanine N-acetyltransferase
MREALEAILTFGFSTMQLNRIEALTFPQNAASRHLLAKLGFKEEGLLREYEIFVDGPQDMAIYGLLQRDWSLRATGN